jgi:1-acyl-sn-glycerol-3-phosphate acyltransferase
MFYQFVSLVTRFLLTLFTDYHVSGSQNVPPSGPLIVLANHQSNVDPPLVGTFVGRKVRFMAKEELFHVFMFGWCVTHYQAFPLRRGEADRQAVRKALDILGEGGAVGLFPEGHRSRDSRLQRGQPGTALIALRSKAPVLPVAIHGSRSAVRGLWRRPRLDITMGPLFYPQADRGLPGREELERVTDEMMAHVAALLPDEERGWYRERVSLEQ